LLRINSILLTAVALFTSFSGISAQKSIQAFFQKSPPVIDGVFEKTRWSDADSATGFIQMEPHPGEPSTETTVAWFGFDDKNIYAVIKCYQRTQIIAKNQSRDALSKSDDIAGLFIDTYNDNRSGYGYLVNPLGTQIDFSSIDNETYPCLSLPETCSGMIKMHYNWQHMKAW